MTIFQDEYLFQKCAAEVGIVPTAQAGATQHRGESAEPVQELLLQSDSVCTDGASATIEQQLPAANTVSRCIRVSLSPLSLSLFCNLLLRQ
uniref:Meis_PKNOX_N domain-containing protein n=1 Tax=Angiostrongylus cantonensis TaxID=6313 RepID=A0A0K0DN61_ANGCA